MRITKHLKKNNGSTLTLVLFMLFMLSVTAVAVITLTGSELSMSVMTSDRSKALMVAQAGAEKAAQVIDEAVAQAQEDARVESSKVIQEQIDSFKILDKKGDTVAWNIPLNSPFKRIIDDSDIKNIKILDAKKLNEIYEAEYKVQFYKKINDWPFSHLFDEETVDEETINGGKFTYEDVNKVSEVTLTSQFNSSVYAPAIKSISITSIGEYKSLSNGSIYKRSIAAEFGLLTGKVEKNGVSTSEIPISYGKLTKVRVNKDDKPSILNGKALIAQKNIISVDGLVNVNGDTVCFGTIPTKASDPTQIDYDADGYKFGGIMAGMVRDNSDDSLNYKSDIWTNSNFGSFGNSLMASLLPYTTVLNLPANFFAINHWGSFNITGNVGTLAYLHSLYSTEIAGGKFSQIKVTKNTFARSVKVESEANYSETQLKNVYTYDDLRIDGNNAKVKIGDCNKDGTPNTTGDEGRLVGLNTGNTPSSSVIVAGDSDLYINGSVYVGGSTFYSEYTNANGPCLSGMSIQKSDSRPAEAFELNTTLATDPYKYPGNVFYLYKNNIVNQDGTRGGYINVSKSEVNVDQKLISKLYRKAGLSIEMMEASPVQDQNDSSVYHNTNFSIMEKAMHIKWIWDHFWTDPGYGSYINTGDIKISTNSSGQIKGWCGGGVGANDKVYGPYGGDFTDVNRDNYIYKIQPKGNEDYEHLMDLFINNKNDFDEANQTKNFATSSVSKVALANTDFFKNTPSNTFMFYGNGNVVLSNDSVKCNGITNSLSIVSSYIRGIVYSTGDIYVRAGTQFKGILIAEGNIVFFGNPDDTTDTIDIEYDEDIVDILLNEEPLVGRFFKHTAFDLLTNDTKAIVQTIKKADVKNIKIISWKEV